MIDGMEGFGGLFGDPEEMRRRMEELQEQMAGAQKVAWADNAIKLETLNRIGRSFSALPISFRLPFSCMGVLFTTSNQET